MKIIICENLKAHFETDKDPEFLYDKNMLKFTKTEAGSTHKIIFANTNLGKFCQIASDMYNNLTMITSIAIDTDKKTWKDLDVLEIAIYNERTMLYYSSNDEFITLNTCKDESQVKDFIKSLLGGQRNYLDLLTNDNLEKITTLKLKITRLEQQRTRLEATSERLKEEKKIYN